VLKVFSVGVEAGEGLPGSVLGADAAGLLVATADGALRLRKLQQEGRKRLPAGEFLRGQPIDCGTVLDS